nr:hypothetical protein [uncultured bacterium]
MIRKIFWLLSTKYFLENLKINKLVEGNLITCLDAGSNPADSTNFIFSLFYF